MSRSASGDRQTPAAAESLGAHLQQGCGLSAFEFRPLQQPLHPLHQGDVMAGGHQRLGRGALLDQPFQQGIQLAVVRQGVAVLLVWPQFSAGGFGSRSRSSGARVVSLRRVLRRARCLVARGDGRDFVPAETVGVVRYLAAASLSDAATIW